MSDDSVINLPSQKELEKEIGDYLAKKYGGKVKLVSAGMLPQAELEEKSEPKKTVVEEKKFRFDIKPEELIAYLDEYVVQQDEAKAVLATKICTHFNRIRAELERGGSAKRPGRIKSNVLLLGPTGVGKTFLIKLIAQRLGVPFVKGDATKFSETGYVGADVEDLVRDLIRQTDNDLEKAQYGIIYVDEIDKIAASQQRIGADVSRSGVQRALLKPMEETEVDLKVPHDPISMIEAMEHYRATGKRAKRVINTRNILFIMSGAFNGLEEMIKKRLHRQSIGFEQHITSKKDDIRLLKNVKAEDLIEFGFESEFVGRLPVITTLNVLSEEDFFAILKNPNSSVVVGKKQDFSAYDIHLLFEEQALRDVARRAVAEQTGARGLFSVMERVLLPFEKTLPSTQIRYLVLDQAMVADPLAGLAALRDDEKLQKYHEKRYQELFAEEHQLFVDFILHSRKEYLTDRNVLLTSTRLGLMATLCQKNNMDPRDACREIAEMVDHVRLCAEMTSDECGMQVVFNDEAIDRMLEIEPLNLDKLNDKCESVLHVFEYGLRLLSQKSEVSNVVVPVRGIDEPEKFINDVVSENFLS